MITTELPLFSEDKIITPLEAVLHEVTPKTQQKKIQDIDKTSFKKSLDNLFPEQQYEDKDIQNVKEILGIKSKNLTDVEIRDLIAETQYLICSWLDDFERSIFNGLTLNELLHEKGGI